MYLHVRFRMLSVFWGIDGTQSSEHNCASISHASSVKALLLGLPDTWIGQNEGQGTWSTYGVLGHLIHGELTDWIPRAKRIPSVRTS